MLIYFLPNFNSLLKTSLLNKSIFASALPANDNCVVQSILSLLLENLHCENCENCILWVYYLLDRSCYPPTQPLVSSLKPAPRAVFLSQLSSWQLPSFWFFRPKTWVILDSLLSYATSNQLVENPGSFAFKIEPESKPSHSLPATTLVQTTSRLDYCRRRFTGIPASAPAPSQPVLNPASRAIL